MPVTTTRPAFAIFTDEPSAPPPPKPKSAPSTSAPKVANSGRVVVATAGDKENVDPLTGQLPSIEEQLAKKRKTGVLAAKLVVTTKAPQPELKKRKVLTISSSTNRTRSEKKERKTLGPKKNTAQSSSRSPQLPELPKVEEEDAESEETTIATTQKFTLAPEQVDARCYELTVLPLADVSAAYSPASLTDDEIISAGEKLKAITLSETSAERTSSPAPSIPNQDDHTTESKSSATTAPIAAAASESTGIPDFSTPERKRIYSAFTFSSPSPAGERYAVTMAHSADRFSDIAFTLDRSR